MPDVLTSEGLGFSAVPQKVRILAEALSRIHGPVIIRNEQHGLHIYMASPAALQKDGRKELRSRHLTVNASKYLKLPPFTGNKKNKNPDWSAVCHKYDTRYRVSELLEMLPLEERGIPNVKAAVIDSSAEKEKFLIDDGNGNKIPMSPGKTVPLCHPAAEAGLTYLEGRGYRVDSLESQFGLEFCIEETPESPGIGLYYRRLPLDVRDTPQGRIVFSCFIDGVRQGWQARVLEKVEEIPEGGGLKLTSIYHPYKNTWVPYRFSRGSEESWQYVAEVGESRLKWNISKYKTAFGMSRSKCLMGIDAADEWNKEHGTSTAILMEGPLDAGRIGPPGLAMLGKYLNDGQAMLLNRYRRVVMLADNDQAGGEALKRAQEVLQDHRTIDFISEKVPSGFKDVGEMSNEAAWDLVKELII